MHFVRHQDSNVNLPGFIQELKLNLSKVFKGASCTEPTFLDPDSSSKDIADQLSTPDHIYSDLSKMQEKAERALCINCPIRIDCLTYALVSSTPHYTWGLSVRHRAALRRAFRAKYVKSEHTVESLKEFLPGYLENFDKNIIESKKKKCKDTKKSVR